MGKVKIKRKSTLIDMTAMSDVTVLLLTFFMLTSTFLQKEPVTVMTPSSVSEQKVPTANLASILVSPEGKVFISLAGDADAEMKDEWGTEAIRASVLKEAVKLYNQQNPSKAIQQPSFSALLQRYKGKGMRWELLPCELRAPVRLMTAIQRLMTTIQHAENPRFGVRWILKGV